jgi:hypothetical protein
VNFHLEILAGLFLILWNTEIVLLAVPFQSIWEDDGNIGTGWLYPLKGKLGSREYRPPALGKTEVGCERTWLWINTCRNVSVGSHIPSGMGRFNYPSALPCRRGVGGEMVHNLRGNHIWRGCDAAFKGKTLKGESHECQWHETRPQDGLRSKPLRGWESLKAELIGWGKPEKSLLRSFRAEGRKNLMRGAE